jgi:predicted DNA-binding antitoxin AbrB/MazE fold protein
MEIIEAEFEDGVLRPLRPLPLRPGERVGLVVVRRPDPARWDLDRLSKRSGNEDQELAEEEGLADWAAETAGLELATDEALGRVEPQS